MRERVKYRAFNTSTNKMHDVAQITIAPVTWSVSKGYGVSVPYQPHIILLQYTGIKIAEEKELYEHDLVCYEEKIYLVEYRYCGFKLKSAKGVFYPMPTDRLNIKLMGSVYDPENPFVQFSKKHQDE